ncbi:glycosyltransferase [Neotamlana laminarinivorans]|uniref:Glycosyltransferase family 2 protein n=1 Tax=Neotamlana laminarinivorans TaxID=2883124 RepID=A0A9X1I0I5_9FLAO|nr:glycosyltransferase family 2 protein [Tamlana laminarinivorans]MCB4799564.1 glycosyltransferase family 2 protein [Tamlana laminarinivorans]
MLSNLQSTSNKIKSGNYSNLIVLTSTFLLILLGISFFYVFHEDFIEFNEQRRSSTLGYSFLIIASALFIYKAFFFLYMFFKYFKYKPIEAVSNKELPKITVIVPAYNESRQVFDTLMSLNKSDYPKDKFQLISVDDGSKDDTWQWMQKAKAILGENLELHQQPKNMGKRHALYYGFKKGTGDVFVTVDSDSIVTEDTLKNLVSPFIKDKNCGAVAGNIRVLNNSKELLPKMLDVSFVLSFEFVRSAESTLKSVFCTPGALAAYKKESVLNCLNDWINQTFMGQPSDIGEDRALTNMILKQGKHVLFQRNAVAFTNVPDKYTGLYKMFIRWGRSNVRESIEMSKFIFKNFRKGNKLGSRLLFISHVSELIMSFPFLIFMLFFVAVHPLLFLGSTLVTILIYSTFSVAFYSYRYKIKEAIWAYTYSILYTFSLFWITPYAIVTANRRGWLTRGLAEKK